MVLNRLVRRGYARNSWRHLRPSYASSLLLRVPRRVKSLHLAGVSSSLRVSPPCGLPVLKIPLTNKEQVMSAIRKIQKVWWLIFIAVCVCFGMFRVFQTDQTLDFDQSSGTEQRTSTPSLDFWPNRNDVLSDHVLFFNRIPKTGSEMFVLLLQWLQGVNGFRHIRLPGGKRRRLSLGEQESLVENVTKNIKNEAIPVSFDRHVYFTNFSEFDQQPPIFFNLVRNPIDKLISRFYYDRVTPNPLNPDIKFSQSTPSTKSPKYGKYEDCFASGDVECVYYSGKPYDLAVPYFCGHHRQCMILNDRWALARAKKNIELFFPVVGVLEQLNATLSVLEQKLPLFFKGVQDMYFHELLEPHRNANRMRPRYIEPEIRKKLEISLVTEFDLYYWVRARLLQQANEILK